MKIWNGECGMRNVKIEDKKMRGLIEVENKSSNSQPLNFLTSYLLVLLIALTLTACWEKKPENPIGPSKTISFSGSSSGYNVYMAKNSSLSSGDILAVDVKVNNVTGVYGAAFDVDFDSSRMTYNAYTAGSFLEQGGNSVTYNAANQSGNSGKLLVGVSRQAGASGATGSGTLVTLKFNVTSGGNIAFSNSALKDSSDAAISGITWGGGTVTVH